MGSVVISLDAELGWGYHDLRSDRRQYHLGRMASVREMWFPLVDLFERWDVRATWALVGHLFLERCDGVHPEIPVDERWFGPDPGGDRTSSPEWFGRDLIDYVHASPVGHELASHTFSHVQFGTPGTSREVADAELRQSNELARDYGVEFDSLVFPRNNVGHLDVVADNGFTCYRGPIPDCWYERIPASSAGKFARYALRGSPPIVEPSVGPHGLVNVPASLYLYGFEGAAQSLVTPFSKREDPTVDQVEAGLRTLVECDDGLFHLWLHPNNVSTERGLARVESVLGLVDAYRRNYGIDVVTMREVADAAR